MFCVIYIFYLLVKLSAGSHVFQTITYLLRHQIFSSSNYFEEFYFQMRSETIIVTMARLKT